MQNSVNLAFGLLMLYDIRDRSPFSRIKAPEHFNWGTVYSISPFGGTLATQENDVVLFNGETAVCMLAFGRNAQFPIIEAARIVMTEILGDYDDIIPPS